MNAAEDAAPPTDFESLRRLILARHDSLPKRLAQVARFSVENPEDIAFGTAASIAEAAEVQPSTLVRLAQSLGYQGFSDLQAVFRERLKARTASYDERLAHAGQAIPADASGAQTIAIGVLNAAVHSVERAQRSLDAEALERATDILADAETIYVLAQKRSFPAASYLGYIFGKLRMRVVVVGSAQGGEEDQLALAGPKDAAIAISFTPYASATVEWAQTLAAQEVPVIGLTDSLFSPLVNLSAVWLEVVEADFEGFRSLGATMALSVTLAVAAARKRRER
ncbi:MurR/RpiR family transcriptional regulator [Jiella sp. M17.18]|uniref:MurR/RpiR family transcriptional regulator n=1 Tax=Jiella sp. M17.18 TaxID=3234247 RepID=UPI0034DE719D